MSGFTYLINVAVNGGGAFGRLSGQAGAFENTLDKVNAKAKGMGANLEEAGRRGRSSFDGMRSSLTGFIATLGVAAFTLGSLNTTVDARGMDRAIEFAGGAKGAENLRQVKQTIEDLHLPTQGSLEGFKTLAGGMIGTGVAAQTQQDIFRSMGEAAVVMGLNVEQTKGSFLALSQMASKGTVSAEELRGQLGERLPGAFAIAARAMGVSTAELGKMMEQGKVVSAEFLPKFAAELHRTFGPGVADAMSGPRTAFNDLGNAIYDLKILIGTELMPVATALITNVLVPMVSWIGKNKESIGLLASAIGGIWVATKLYALWTTVAAIATGGFTGTILGLNVALLNNPMTWVIGSLVALAGAAIYAWNTFDGFRGGLYGIWEVMKTFVGLVIDRFVTPVVAAFQIISAAWSGDLDAMQNGMNNLLSSASAWSKDMGDEMSKAYDVGYNKGTGAEITKLADMDRLGTAMSPDALNGVDFKAGQPAPGAKASAGRATKLSSGITGGGNRNVTINIGEFGNGLTIQTTHINEGAEQIKEMMMKALLQVINSANQVQTSNG